MINKKFGFLRKKLTGLVKKINRKAFSSSKTTKSIDKKRTELVQAPTNNEKKDVLMFGWELPPFNSGGLGVACYDLAESMAKKNANITFVLPKRQDIDIPFMKVAYPEGGDLIDDSKDSKGKKNSSNLSIKEIDTLISPYSTEHSYQEKRKLWEKLFGIHGVNWIKGKYGSSLIGEVYRYGAAAAAIAKKEKFSVIHAHDWLAYPAGIMAKKVSKKPLVVHVHALEYDRSQEHSVDPRVCAIEKMGMEKADKVIAISHYVKNRVMHYYGIPSEKIEVVHNGITLKEKPSKKLTLKSLRHGGNKIVLFVGRITYQKGVDYLIEAAAKAIRIDPKIVFMIVGSGDMQNQIIEQAANLGLSDKVFFPGFLRGGELKKVYSSADLFVMPSVSEPFGLVALEALANKVPVILSKQSGASEVIKHSLKVDFWDTDELANKIVAVTGNGSLRRSLSTYGFKEVKGCTWDLAADKCIQVYSSVCTA